MTRSLAWRLKNISAYVGVGGYVLMIITGSVMVGVASKTLAELLRISFYLQSDAKDMARMSAFFVVTGIITLIWNLL